MSSHLLPEISRAPARREPDLPLPGICRLGRRDPRGAAADPGWPRTRSGPSGHRTHVEIGSREGPVAGSLISHLASAIPRCPSRLRERPDLLHARRPVPPIHPSFHDLRTRPLSREPFAASLRKLAIVDRARVREYSGQRANRSPLPRYASQLGYLLRRDRLKDLRDSFSRVLTIRAILCKPWETKSTKILIPRHWCGLKSRLVQMTSLATPESRRSAGLRFRLAKISGGRTISQRASRWVPQIS